MKTVKIEIGAVRSKIVEAPSEAIQLLREELAVPVPSAQHTTLFKQGKWDGKHRFIRAGSNAFPTGLLDRIIKTLGQAGFRVFHEDTTHMRLAGFDPQLIRKCLHGVELREYQIETVGLALARGRMAIQCPTGGGKTEIGAAIVKILRKPTLWIVHRKELLYQTADRLLKCLAPSDPVRAVGMLGGGHNCSGFVTVAMVQTLASLPPDFFEPWKVLVVDEVHHLSAETWLDVANSCDNAHWRFGLSGTIVTGNRFRDLRLEGATGPVHVVATTMGLAKKGFLAKPLIVMRKIDRWSYPSYEEVRQEVCPGWRANPRQLRPLGGKLFATAYRRGIIENKERNDSIAELAVSHQVRGRKVLVLCTKLAHGRRLVQRITEGSNPGVWWLHGSKGDSIRQEALDSFKLAHKGGVLIASTIFDEGVDIPEIDVLILAGAGESMIKSIQRIGRALRPRTDKDHVLIYDFADGRGGHEKDYLKNHALRRVSDYKDQGFDVEE